MKEARKLAAAQRFLDHMKAAVTDRPALEDYLSAFLAAARSVLDYALGEASSKPGGRHWYDTQIKMHAVVCFLRDERDDDIHEIPVSPSEQVNVFAYELIKVGGNERTQLVGDGAVAESSSASRDDIPTARGNETPGATIWVSLHFKRWPGPEDVLTLCTEYLAELRRIVAEGQQQGFLTP